jgi:hydrogenase maturation protein HypF
VDFFAVTPECVACDLHPDYASTRHAEQLATAWDVPLVRVQHHHAHVAACMAEHRLTGPVLGFAWDGTGYGPDGTVWGGEVLRCEGADFTRVAHLRTFPLPGGDVAVREPRRAALGLLYAVFGAAAAPWVEPWFSPPELRVLLAVLPRARLFPQTSSLGRLFDAVAALCGLPPRVTFEGQAAMRLEYGADPAVEAAYAFPLSEATPAIADWEPLVRAVLEDRRVGLPVAVIAAKFHNALADLAVAVARRANCPQIALTGGCFQNALLTVRVRERLLAAGYNVYIHQEIPPGDGGIALGQVLVAAAGWSDRS